MMSCQMRNIAHSWNKNILCLCKCHWYGVHNVLQCDCEYGETKVEGICYYGRLDGDKPKRNLSEDIIMELNKMLKDALSELEENVKHTIIDSKKEILKILRAPVIEPPKVKKISKKALSAAKGGA